jgi:hypothetical protein
MSKRQFAGLAAPFALLLLLSTGRQAYAEQPTSFSFTPTFRDPDPGTRQWERRGNGYVETLPSGRVNTFRIQKPGVVHGLKGTILQKVEDPHFFVFLADSKAARQEMYWWKGGPAWQFLGLMKEGSAPGRFD